MPTFDAARLSQIERDNAILIQRLSRVAAHASTTTTTRRAAAAAAPPPPSSRERAQRQLDRETERANARLLRKLTSAKAVVKTGTKTGRPASGGIAIGGSGGGSPGGASVRRPPWCDLATGAPAADTARLAAQAVKACPDAHVLSARRLGL